MGDSAPTKSEREKCWTAKDNYWNCIDKYEEDLGTEKAIAKCVDLRKPFEEMCSKTWVKHFDRRREYVKFRAQIDAGYNPLGQDNFKTSGYKPPS